MGSLDKLQFKIYKNFFLIVLFVFVLSWSSCSIFHHGDKKTTGLSIVATAINDSTKRGLLGQAKTGSVKPYKEVITSKAKSDSGLILVHIIDNHYYFEISKAVLNKDILVTTRIAKGATGIRPSNQYEGYAGDLIGSRVIRFEFGGNDKVFIREISYSERASDTTLNGMYKSLANSNLQPIVAAFDIKAYAKDSASVVIDVNEILNSDNPLFFFSAADKTKFSLGGYQADKSYLEAIQSMPINVEIQTVKTFKVEQSNATFEINTSLVLLPLEPMKPRTADPRVGYFSESFTDFDKINDQQRTEMITRFRLEPKEQDKQRYLNGELVEPKKPIIYYIDPATPKKWVPYLIKGINDWQVAFEKAGFKNAIYALEAPKNDPDFNLYDARHNAVVYKPSAMANAMGPHIHDPRTGEILETHISWFHNVMSLLHDWYMVQAGPNDPQARTMHFSDELMGQLIRFVSSHEVGHTLGLLHNMGASSTVPVEKLRDEKYLTENGFCPSIMDYARFNYVAQPQDKISQNNLFPRIGMYDKWAIEWGYRWLPDLTSKEQEAKFMDNWIVSKLKTDNRFWFGAETGLLVTDPRRQTEDLGDDAMKAGEYGIKNLKVVMNNLLKWTMEPHSDYSNLQKMNDQVIGQYQRYLFHVLNNIGLTKTTVISSEQAGTVVTFIPKLKQKRAVQFLQEQLFDTPTWLMNKQIFSLVGGTGPKLSGFLQEQVINNLVSPTNFEQMLTFQLAKPQEAYYFDDLLDDLEAGIFKEFTGKVAIDVYRRTLQKAYVDRLITQANFVPTDISKKDEFLNLRRTDFYPIIQSHINTMIIRIDKALPKYTDQNSKAHLLSLKSRLIRVFKPDAPFIISTNSKKLQSGLQGVILSN